MKSGLLFTLMLLVVSACVMPAPPMETPAPTAPVVPEAAETEMPAQAPTSKPPSPQPTSAPAPLGTPVAHLLAGAPVVISLIHMLDDDQGWALGSSATDIEHILRTGAAGQTWKDVTPPEPIPGAGVPLKFLPFFLDETTAWGIDIPSAGSGSSMPVPAVVWRTADGGTTWQSSADLRTADLMVEGWLPSYMTFVDGQHGWLMVNVGAGAGHAYVVIFRTSDGGVTWERVLDPYSLDSGSVHVCCQSGLFFASPDVGLIPLADNNYVKIVVNWTTDGGASWTASFPPPPPSATGLFDRASCAVTSTAVLSLVDVRLGVRCRVLGGGADEDYIYVTADQGGTWTAMPYPGGDLRFFDERTGLALGRDIFRTDDAGATWTKIKTVNWDGQFSFVSEDLGWAVARSGDAIALVRTTDGGQRWEEIETRIAP